MLQSMALKLVGMRFVTVTGKALLVIMDVKKAPPMAVSGPALMSRLDTRIHCHIVNRVV